MANPIWRLRNRMSPQLREQVRGTVDVVLAPIVGSWNSGTAPEAFALTLDDGPDPEITPALIDRFAELDVRVTFFLLTLRAEAAPRLVERLVGAGHEVALHGLDHRRVSAMGRADAESYLRDARVRLEQVAGRPVTMFRPPYGSQSLASFRGARAAGLDVVVWNGDAADWEDRAADEVTRAAVAASTPGAILLFHERLEPDPRHPDPARAAPVTTFDRVQVITDIVAGTRARGLAPVTVSELASAGRIHRTAWLRP